VALIKITRTEKGQPPKDISTGFDAVAGRKAAQAEMRARATSEAMALIEKKHSDDAGMHEVTVSYLTLYTTVRRFTPMCGCGNVDVTYWVVPM
jgi:hypothetical protein